MLNIRNVEEIESFLRSLPDLVSQHANRSPVFIENVDYWLKSLEKTFEANRLYQAGLIAMLRNTMVAVKQGQIPTGIEVSGRRSRTRILKAVASDAMQQGAEVASHVIEENRPRINDAIRVAQQIVAAAFSRNLIPQRDAIASNSEYLKLVRHSVASVTDLEGAVVHLEGLIGRQDALILLDRALSSYLHVASPPQPAVSIPAEPVRTTPLPIQPEPPPVVVPPTLEGSTPSEATPKPEESEVPQEPPTLEGSEVPDEPEAPEKPLASEATPEPEEPEATEKPPAPEGSLAPEETPEPEESETSGEPPAPEGSSGPGAQPSQLSWVSKILATLRRFTKL